MKGECYRVIELEKGLWAIAEDHVRMFLAEGENRALLLDTGFGGGDLKGLVSALTDKPLTVALTHADRDHTGGLTQFGGEVFLHPAEFDRLALQFAEGVSMSPLWEGDEVKLGGRSFTPIHVPGHTPGSLAFLDRERGVLLSGDSVQEGPIFMFGSGRNFTALAASMRKLEKWIPEIKTVYPCHNAMPVDASFIPEIRRGAEAMLKGELEGYPPKRTDMDCLEFAFERIKFYAYTSGEKE